MSKSFVPRIPFTYTGLRWLESSMSVAASPVWLETHRSLIPWCGGGDRIWISYRARVITIFMSYINLFARMKTAPWSCACVFCCLSSACTLLHSCAQTNIKDSFIEGLVLTFYNLSICSRYYLYCIVFQGNNLFENKR